MKKTMLAITALTAAVVLGIGAAAFAADDATDVKIQGEILDMGCYMGHEAHGSDHAGCALKCVKGGQPVGLLAEDGTVYLLFASHKDGSAFEQAKELAGKKVVLTGMSVTRGGIHAIEVASVDPA